MLENGAGRWYYNLISRMEWPSCKKGEKEMKSKNERTIEYLEENSTLVGQRTRKLVDQETGEVMQVNQVTKLAYGSKNFWKLYMKEFVSILKELNDKQYKVFVYILEHTRPSDNHFIATYQGIMKDVGCCRQTVASTLGKLKDNNFMRKVQTGVWIVNPDIILKGNDRKRSILLSEYRAVKPEKKPGKKDGEVNKK